MLVTEKQNDSLDVRSNSSQPESSMRAAAPELTSRGLTSLLILMCTVPVVTIAVLWTVMPPVFPRTLNAEFSLADVPPKSYYEATPLSERSEFPNAMLVIKNTGDQTWTHINVRINSGKYQIYETNDPIKPGEERRFKLNRFVHRSGAIFQVGINRPYSVELYARLPDRSRGTFEGELD